jgi:putative nucleotidyltransferase with HDIG domain
MSMELTPSDPPIAADRRRSILVVSGEAEEAARIKRGFEDMRSKWDLEFATDAPSGLALAGAKSFDAVIVDLLLPDLAGLKVVRELLESSPETLRIGLTTAAERQVIPHVEAPVHQLLSKPCDPKVLTAVLARAFAAQDFALDEPFRKVIAGIASLPALPQVYLELMQELKSEEPSLEKAGQIVARDMALTAKILQLVNSAFFALGRPIAHPAEAAIFLGTETLKALVLSLQVFSQFMHLRLPEFSVENLWNHCWTTGVLAKKLCEFEDADRTTIGEAFIAGLLHDVGKLLLAANYPNQLQQSIREARQNSRTLWEQEYSLHGASHAEVGGYLLSRWGLPASVVEAVAFHHRPSQARRQAFGPLTAVHAANTLGRLQPNNCNLIHQPFDEDYLRGLGLTGRLEGWKQLFKDSIEKRS